MQLHLRRPGSKIVQNFARQQAQLPLSYAEVGYATGKQFPIGFDHDRMEVRIGSGTAVFKRARASIMNYDHFPCNWSFAVPENEADILPGQHVGVVFHQLGIWWINGARVIELIDQPEFYGFSYGTLSTHVERGEELFYTRMDDNDEVYYGIQAYSQPRFWGAKIAKPYARWQQERFRRDSAARMQMLVKNG